MKILIVEDEPSLREIMVRELEQEHYVVETASTFDEADSKIAGYTYDCILLDIWGSNSAPTTTSRSRSIRPSCWPAYAACCAADAAGPIPSCASET